MLQAEETLIDELVGFERAGDLAQGMRNLSAREWSIEALTDLAVRLYHCDLTAFPLVLMDQLRQAGRDDWVVHAISAHLALRLDRMEVAEASIARLAARLGEASDVERAKARYLLDPLLPIEVVDAFRFGQTARLRALARLWSAVEPETMRRLAPPPADRQPDYRHLLDPPDEGRLLSFAVPPADAPRRQRKAVLAMRRQWAPRPNSREHEVPARIAAGMASYGWRPHRYHIRSFTDRATATEDYRAIAELCRDPAVDCAIIDEFQPARDGNTAPGEIFRALKRDRPELRLIGLYLDPWMPVHWDNIEAAAEILDGFWSPVVTPLWSRPAFRGKTLLCPWPHGELNAAPAPLHPVLGFAGGVQLANWYRAFWLTAIADAGLATRFLVSGHQGDELPALESYRRFLCKTGAMGASLNLAMRANGSRIVTGRTFEVPAAAGLLVQEQCGNVDLFFVPGRHYLRFDTLSDLADIVHLLRVAPEQADAIRRAGADFFRERYSDQKIMAYFDHFIFHRPEGGPSHA